jgi:hypothetical protein
MAAYSEGLNILRHANVGKNSRTADAGTALLRNPELCQYDFNPGDIAEAWRRGGVVASWLLDLTAIALFRQPDLSKFSGRVSDSGGPLDYYRRHRRRGSRSGLERRAVPAVRIERRRELRRQAALGHAIRVSPGPYFRCRRNPSQGDGNRTTRGTQDCIRLQDDRNQMRIPAQLVL